ncbi:MAG: hypothetical protein ABJN26_07210, partial [Stappiaceae bacterium]
MTHFAKIALAASALAVAGMMNVASVTPADASEHCKKVYIQVTNNTGAPIKMVDLDYRDYGSRKWRSEPT